MSLFKTSLSTILATTIFATSYAQAASILNTTPPKGKILVTINTTTPGGQMITLDSLQVFAGTSCDNAVTPLMKNYLMSPGSSSIDSMAICAIVKDSPKNPSQQCAIGQGGGATCLKEVAVYHGKTYTVGPLQLTWDPTSQMYTAVNPNTWAVNFTN